MLNLIFKFLIIQDIDIENINKMKSKYKIL